MNAAAVGRSGATDPHHVRPRQRRPARCVPGAAGEDHLRRPRPAPGVNGRGQRRCDEHQPRRWPARPVHDHDVADLERCRAADRRRARAGRGGSGSARGRRWSAGPSRRPGAAAPGSRWASPRSRNAWPTGARVPDDAGLVASGEVARTAARSARPRAPATRRRSRRARARR